MSISLETAKKLRAAGFPQDTNMYWNWRDYQATIMGGDWRLVNEQITEDAIAAPNTDELLAQLPTNIKHNNEEWYIDIAPSIFGWGVYYMYLTDIHERIEKENVQGKSLSEALAEMWLLLKEKGIIK